MNEYSDITLLDCNRKESAQAETTADNSQWTNRLGKVVQLNIGDTISVAQAFINQKGCANPQSIEFRGNVLGTGKIKSFKLQYSEDEYSSDINELRTPNNVVDSPLQAVFRRTTEEEYLLKDNEMKIETNYYKNANGEGYMMLPRNFWGSKSTAEAAAIAKSLSQGTSDDNQVLFGYSPTATTQAGMFWTNTDALRDCWGYTTGSGGTLDHFAEFSKGALSGVCPYQFDLNDTTRKGQTKAYNFFNANDYNIVKGGTIPDSVEVGGSSTKFNDIDWFNEEMTGHITANVKPYHDNSRFTMMSRRIIFNNYSNKVKLRLSGARGGSKLIDAVTWWAASRDFSQLAEYGVDNYEMLPDPTNQLDPALSTYDIHTDITELSIEKGFHSPQSIAVELTQQIQKQKDYSPERMNFIETNTGQAQYFNTAIHTQTYKPYQCASLRTFGFTQWNQFFNGTWNLQATFDYYGATNNIFVKRADLFVAGRKCNNWLGYVGYGDSEANPSATFSGNFTKPFDVNLTGTSFGKWGKPNFIKNDIAVSGGAEGNNTTDSIVTSWEYTKDNLENLNELFKVQSQYPELFKVLDEDINNPNPKSSAEFLNVGTAGVDYTAIATIDNSRFLHMNIFDYDSTTYIKLGDDGYKLHSYYQYTHKMDRSHQSMPIFFKYDKKKQDKYIKDPTINNLSYGFATKKMVDGIYYIEIHPELVNGIRPEFFEFRGGFDDASSGLFVERSITKELCIIGWDFHYNSYGNVVMTGFTGDLPTSYNGAFTGGQYQWNNQETIEYSDNISSRTYIGANNSALVYDQVSGRFGFEYLHNPEFVGQNWNAGSTDIVNPTTTATNNNPIVSDAGNECYKINKRLNTWTFCPDLCPYTPNVQGTIGTFSATEKVELSLFNNNLSPWVIYDSHCGVNFNLGECFKVASANDEKKQGEIWDNSFLGKLGFTYDQFNPKVIGSNNNGQARVDFRNVASIYNPTTNSQDVATDTNSFIVNPWGAIMYSTQLPHQYYISTFNTAAGVNAPQTYFPAITQDTKSIKIEAVSLPKITTIPYLSIRSDILSESKYIGGLNSGLTLPIISTINKINADKDYIQLGGSDLSYTITKPTSFSSITTQITNPDGTLALTDDGNAVIYKIVKKGNLENYDIISQILQKKK